MIRFSSMISSFEERRVYRRTTSLCEFLFVMYIGTLQFLLHFILHDTLESPIIWLIMILARVCIALYLNQIGKLQGQLWKSSEWLTGLHVVLSPDPHLDFICVFTFQKL